jgi:hypothetical protein
MTPTVARVISALAMQDIRNLAVNQSSCLRVRWDSDAQIWRDLLVAVATDNEAALDEVRLHAKLLFCGSNRVGWQVLNRRSRPPTTGTASELGELRIGSWQTIFALDTP